MKPGKTCRALTVVGAILCAGAAAPAIPLSVPVPLAAHDAFAAGRSGSSEVQRPEGIVSKRIRIYSTDRYRELRDEWEAYTKGHPKDPIGWVELAKASRYAGVPCDEYIPLAEKALRLDPDCAQALSTVGNYRWKTYCPSQPEDPKEAIRLLERALEIDPYLDEPHYTLWVMRLSQGNRAEAEEQLRDILNGGFIPEPLADFAHNLLVGLEPNAILLTNGDNDTYPPLALQATRGFRTDVAVVNLSLLNTEWYREEMRSEPHRVPVPKAVKPDQGEIPARKAVRELLANLAADGWRRPLYVATTVFLSSVAIPNELSLEGLVYRVKPEKADPEEEYPPVDAPRMRASLERNYRLESATSMAMDWEAYNAIRSLMVNYIGAYTQLAHALATAGDQEGSNQAMDSALRLCEFHGQTEKGRELAQRWQEWEPDSKEAARWLARFRGE